MSPRGAARRRLTKAGLGAAGVLWSLESRATLSPMICYSPSAGYSGKLGKLSSNYTKKAICSGKPPEYWDAGSGWPCSRTTKFGNIFNCNSRNQKTYGGKTLLEIVKGCDFDGDELAKELVAAYLNILSGRISFLSQKNLTDMWSQLQGGFYRPAPNVIWTAKLTVAYLKATHYPSSYYD